MARIPFLAVSAALLLSPAVAHAQDGGGQPTPAPTPTPSSQPIERVQGVPDDFTLQPQADTVRRNRNEPTIQPLPQPSAVPRQVAPTPSPTPSPTLAAPVATPSPRLTLPAQRVEETTPQSPSPVQRSTEPVDGQAPLEEPETSVTTGPDIAEESASPNASVPSQVPAPVAQDSAETSWGWLAWLLAGVLAIAALAAGAWWWLRQKGEVGFTVEKIEPYRPPEAPPASEPAQSRPEPEQQPAAPPRPATPNPSGLVQASRPASTANTGGFVTSTISTRPRQPQPSQPPQAPRRYTSPDGRIVTSLSPSRRDGD
ncbi:hypothetical protein [Aurantiacibacter odishensis]|uniref:hypothetical protein n=1 Tax=Aurantiacibacter odishensis TaxID=1155476 RepID=UPI0013C4DADE|nr:hypothetical protein [Aurantiacibacter odishensis]